jgi:hypothetical protein
VSWLSFRRPTKVAHGSSPSRVGRRLHEAQEPAKFSLVKWLKLKDGPKVQNLA